MYFSRRKIRLVKYKNEIIKRNANMLASATLNTDFLVLLETVQRHIDSSYELGIIPLGIFKKVFPRFWWTWEKFPTHVPNRVIVDIADRVDYMWLVNVTGSWRDGVVTATLEEDDRPKNQRFSVCSGPKNRNIWGLLVNHPGVYFGNPNVIKKE